MKIFKYTDVLKESDELKLNDMYEKAKLEAKYKGLEEYNWIDTYEQDEKKRKAKAEIRDRDRFMKKHFGGVSYDDVLELVKTTFPERFI